MNTTKNLTLPGKTKPYIMAHRGNRARLPENTLASFQQALTDGADILETDLHLTRDQVFVCIHDDSVDRTTNGHGAVAGMTLQELKQLNAAPSRPELPPQTVPTLAELAAILPENVALALELKTDRFLEAETCHRLVAELEQNGVRQRSIVLSFSLARIRAVQAAAPDIPIGLITLTKLFPQPGVELCGPLWPLLALNPLYVWLAHRRGQLVCPLDTEPDRRLWLYRLLHCDAILTDNPHRTAALVKK